MGSNFPRLELLPPFMQGQYLIGIMRGFSTEAAVQCAHAALEGGLTTIEVTSDSPRSFATLRALRDLADDTSLRVGMGTITTAELVTQAVSDGAQFLVTPHTDRVVISRARELEVPCVVGALTPTEVLAAASEGAALVKLFPASLGGPQYLKDLVAPCGSIPLLATGGITLENTAAYLAAGAAGFGIGGAVFPRDAVERGEFSQVTERLRAFKKLFEGSQDVE